MMNKKIFLHSNGVTIARRFSTNIVKYFTNHEENNSQKPIDFAENKTIVHRFYKFC